VEIAIFIAYLLLVVFALSKIPFFENSSIGGFPLIALFALKVLAGIAYAKFYLLPKYYTGSDTWRFYNLSLTETKWLLEDPAAFIKDLFVHGYNTAGNVFSGENSYWNDLKSNVPVKLLAIMNVFTHNSYWANIILFNALFILGLVALFKVFNDLFPGKKWWIIAGLFLLPSTLFWCSGIHKDGLILSATGLLIYCFYNGLKHRFNGIKIVAIIVCSILIFSLRNYVLFALMPALIALFFSYQNPSKTVFIFFTLYLVGISLFFLIPLIIPIADFPAFICNKQQEFLALEAGSIVSAEELQPTFQSFLEFFPSAFNMAFLRPNPTEIKNVSYIPAAAEILLLITLIILSLIKMDKTSHQLPFKLFFFLFAISIMMIAGYTIPFTGAIVRYRSFVLPFLVTPLLCSIKLRREATGMNT
jgi:hypothetical protein